MGNKTKNMPVSFRGYGWRDLQSLGIKDRLDAGVVRTFGYIRTGGNLPQYRKIIRAGGPAMNPMVVTVTNGEFTPDLDHTVSIWNNKNTPNGLVRVTDSWGFVGVGDSLAPPVLFGHEGSAAPLVDACKAANRILHKKWTSRRRQIQGGVFLAELRKTIAMVTKPAKTLRQKVPTLIRRLAKAKKRGTGRNLRDLKKIMADSWLEATFGWKPLIADLKDGAVAIGRVATRDALERQQFRAYGEGSELVQTSVGFQSVGCVSGATDLGFRITDVTRRNGYCVIYGRWQTKLQDAPRTAFFAHRLEQLSGITTWEDVAPQVWELVPWSFLVDYFTNIGDVIEASGNVFDQPMWMVEVDIDETAKTRQYVYDLPYWGTHPRLIAQSGGDLTRKTSYKQIERKAFDYSALYPSVSFSLPTEMQWLNITALIAGGRSFQPFTNR